MNDPQFVVLCTQVFLSVAGFNKLHVSIADRHLWDGFLVSAISIQTSSSLEILSSTGEASCDEPGNLSQLPIPPNTNSFSKGELLPLSKATKIHQNTPWKFFPRVYPWKWPILRKPHRLPTHHFFRGELLNFGDVYRRKTVARCWRQRHAHMSPAMKPMSQLWSNDCRRFNG